MRDNPSSIADNLNALSPRLVRLFYALSLPVSVGLSLLIFKLSGVDLRSWLETLRPVDNGIAIGAIAGISVGTAFSAIVIQSSDLETLRDIIREAWKYAKPRKLDLVLTSLSAGFCEELLFRGAIQPKLGIIGASLLFAVAHGLSFSSRGGKLLFGLFVWALGSGLGYVCKTNGLVSAMIAHALIDLIALFSFRRWLITNSSEVSGLDA